MIWFRRSDRRVDVDTIREANPSPNVDVPEILAEAERMGGPEFPCRQMPARHCPKVYDAVCGPDRPCARYESDDETPWLPEVWEYHTGIRQPPEDRRTFVIRPHPEPCPHLHKVDITSASDTHERVLCNDCGATITGPLRGYLPKEAPMRHTEHLLALGVVELDNDARLEVDAHNGLVRVAERRPYDWCVRFAGLTPDQAMEFAKSLINAAARADYQAKTR